MASSSSSMTPFVYNDENYHIWVVKMKAFLRGVRLWQYVDEEKTPPLLGPNPTLNQIRMHEEEATKGPRALSIIHQAMHEIDSQGNERSRQMLALNLRREFEVLKMKEVEMIQEYTNRTMKVVNQIRLIGEKLSDQRIVEKILVSIPERYEAKISSLEDSKNFSDLTLSEVVNALKAQDQRRALRQEETTEGAFSAKLTGKQVSCSSSKKQLGEKKEKWKQRSDGNKSGEKKGKYPFCSHYKKKKHLPNYCWYRPNVKCKSCIQLGQIDRMCKNKGGNQVQQNQQAQAVMKPEELGENLFVATCYATDVSIISS
ncbi:uncharacterized protein LOC123208516 [Mangifera indica]|uniref:uncharacterized protein LOC123208516 n=1 Tax=Mangifera indica TaxID=29780 RepID=UPI001CF9E3D7|nr:uncharacterized protein LOC123208516 [Mangifera indica]